MARRLFRIRAARRPDGTLAAGAIYVAYTDSGGTVLADISATSGGSSLPGSAVTLDSLGGAVFYGPTDNTSNLYLRVPADASLGVQELTGDSDARLDVLEAGSVFYVNDGVPFDGTSDYKAAIQAKLDAANAAGGGRVELPRGTGKYSGVMTVYPNTTVRGQGITATVLQSTASSGALSGGAAFAASSATADNIRFEGFELVGNGKASTSGTGISFPGGVHSFLGFADLYVRAFPNHGIHLVDPIMSTLERCWLRDCGQDGLFIDIGTSVNLTAIYATACNRAGIHFKTSTYMTLDACAPEYCTFGYWLESCGNIAFNGCGGEVAMRADGGTAGIVAHHRIQSSQNIVLNGCYSTKFAYLSSVPAYHLYITGSARVLVNGYRGKAPLGGDDPGEAPANTYHIDSASTVQLNGTTFEAELGGGPSGSPLVEWKDTGELVLRERGSDASAPATNHGTLYVRDNGSGKTQVVARFPTGAIQILATEP